MRLRTHWLALAGWLLAAHAGAAPPLSADDADTLAAGACELELEQRRFRQRTEATVVFACTLLLETEIAVGRRRISEDEAQPKSHNLLEIKRVLWSNPDGGWATALSAGISRGIGEARGRRSDAFSFLVTRNFDDTKLHLNLGSERQTSEGVKTRRWTWAAAVEHELDERTTLVAEVVGEQHARPVGQIGARYWLVPKHVELTTSLGAERGAGKDGRWISLGIRFETGS